MRKKTASAIVFVMLFVMLATLVYAYPVTFKLTSSVGNFHTDVYKCTGQSCSSYTPATSYASSFGNPTQYVITGSGKQYFAEFDYKNCYLGQVWRVNTTAATGNGPWEYDINLAKGINCQASLSYMTASSYVAGVGDTITFSASMNSGFSFGAGKPIPPASLIFPYYSSHVDTFFYVNSSLKDEKALDIAWGTDGNVAYNYTFNEPGVYEVSIDTKMDDECKCLNSTWGHKKVVIVVTSECTPGDNESRECGMCGNQEKICHPDGTWGEWSACSDQGVCSPLSNESKNCGDCGNQKRTCTQECTWGAWGSCTGEGTCTPGDLIFEDCGNCGEKVKTCSGLCIWGNWSSCYGEGVCTPGEIENRSCGFSDDGECSYGNQLKTCNENCYWSQFQNCEGAIYPAPEICDDKDNDCDNETDEDLSDVCGTGQCLGTKICTAGVWSECSSFENDCGVCAMCDESGACTVYDGTQDDECSDTLCPDSCFLIPDNNSMTLDFANDVPNECTSIFTCSHYGCSYGHECDVLNCNADCDDTHACENKCVSGLYYHNGNCLLDCTCDYDLQNCNLLNGWYNTTTTHWVDIDQCNEKEEKEQKYRVYSCDINDGCVYLETDTKWVATGNTGYKTGSCDDGLFCTLNDECTQGVCGGAPKNCSESPEDISCTQDFCDELNDMCINLPDDDFCDNGLYCDGEETCDPENDCEYGTPVSCSDGVSCTDDSCSEATDSCSHTTNDGLCPVDTICADNYCDAALNCQVNYEPGTSLCRASAGVCDAPEYCTGFDEECPSDAYETQGTDCGLCAECDDVGECTVYDETQDNECPDTICPNDCNIDCNLLTWDSADNVTNECTDINTCSQYSCRYSHECDILCGAECVTNEDCEGSGICVDCSCEYEPLCGNANIDPGEDCELPGTDNNINCPQLTESCDNHKLGMRDSYGDCGLNCSCNQDDLVYVCVPGECDAECSPGETQTEACGNCGTRTRTCSEECGWGDWTECTDQGECTPGNFENNICGNCGVQLSFCNSECEWSDVFGCYGEGVCTPGSIEPGSCGPETNEGICEPGENDRECLETCQWSDWSECEGAQYPQNEVCNNLDDDCDGEVDENLTWACGITDEGECEYGEQVCENGEWSECDAVYPECEICLDFLDNDCDGEIDENCICIPGETEQGDCGRCGYRERVCLENGEWGEWGEECLDEGVCEPLSIETQECGQTDVGECKFGIEERICSEQCAWDEWGECEGAVFPIPEICSDDKDNDCDGLIDENCHGLTECTDGIDNDGDGLIDLDDPGCKSTGLDNSEYNTLVYQCSDGIDNDGDGLADKEDPGCYTTKLYSTRDNVEQDRLPECSDYFDNDGDGLKDYPADPGCTDKYDKTE